MWASDCVKVVTRQWTIGLKVAFFSPVYGTSFSGAVHEWEMCMTTYCLQTPDTELVHLPKILLILASTQQYWSAYESSFLWLFFQCGQTLSK